MRGSNNNFDFLRFFAASLVVFTHSFMFSPTGSATEPLSYISPGRVNSGGLAVAVFFVISGFLITMSYEYLAGNRKFIFLPDHLALCHGVVALGGKPRPSDEETTLLIRLSQTPTRCSGP